MRQNKDNLILIGMAGAGKSTLGVLLAKALGKNFFDTDLLIQQREGKLLQTILDEDGVNYFLRAEEKAIRSLRLRGCVIATGGSVVYSHSAMNHLSSGGRVIYLKIAYEELAARLTNVTSRGIVFKGSPDLHSVYEERLPLYERYADLTVDCTGRSIEDCVNAIVSALRSADGRETV